MPALRDHRRIVVKIGSALLVDRATGALKQPWLESLADDVAGLMKGGAEVILVSSGAIALGRGRLGLPKGALQLAESQAAAAVGQIALARAYSEVLGAHGFTAAQVLLTLDDTESRRRYLNARATLSVLLERRAVPVINENDTVATTEIRYGDNDRLAARVATMIGADLLVLLSDIDGLYTAPPNDDPDAKLIPVVERITPEIEAMAGGAGSELSRGGMKTKIEAGKIATDAGTAMIITLGKRLNPLGAIDAGASATWFLGQGSPVTARKKWIAGSLDARGTVHVDAGAAGALRRGKSLLPAGCTRVEGRFARGDAVLISGPAGEQLGRGLIAFDADDAAAMLGRKTHEIEAVLGYTGRTVMIHRDDMVLRGE
ncbi:glutamate 5-kinase [Prosthecodimorpha staleyi]|uniref:Glutamate 5-kinase n=1 Tax=Prosthecodimorpha staleyi TaxID=2840188 RepID=A0A947GF44_9HYPH|nr:glutamate 5-kinase [Prosthecodimorpha staleyi]MBT9292742.1 glutamate 5-kinase [Prosthecodimorpha staleyi]